MKLYITDDKKEMAKLGKMIADEKSEVYTPLLLNHIKARIRTECPNQPEEIVENRMYCSIYDYWAYGNTIDEEFYYHFYEKNHEQKSEYMTMRIQNVYMNKLCCGSACIDSATRQKVRDQLELKYQCYELLKPYYKRDVIEIADARDYPKFVEFVKKHSEFVVKPSDFCFGIGVHKASIRDYSSVKEAFSSILSEGVEITRNNPTRRSSIVIEELIVQCDELSRLHPSSVNAVRVTAVRDKEGKIRMLHPWIKCGVGGKFMASSALGGFDALIDEDTGVVISDGYSENGETYPFHPDTKIKIKGFQIPRWDELKELINELMALLPTYGYIGWDMVLTDDGWVVMEANYAGEFIWQLMLQKGCKKEFEDIIGWKMETDFWWETCPR